MGDSDTSPRNITTDHETIRKWVEARSGEPAHITGQVDDDANSLYIVRADEKMEGLDSLSWEGFFETFEAEGLAFVYQDREVGETDEWLYDLVDREEVAERATVDRTELETALMEGEVVESEITETKVIEKTVVETDRIESEVVDSEIIETTTVDREPISRELIASEFTNGPEGLTATLSPKRSEDPLDDRMETIERTDRETETETEVGGPEIDTDSDVVDERAGEPTDERTGESTDEPSAQPVDEPTDGLAVGDRVVLDVQETVLTTTEVLDRKTVESRVVEREIAEEDTVETDAIDLRDVEETILESDLIEGEIVGTATDETVPSGAITSERTEDDTIQSQFVERRLVETESTEHYRLGCDITDHQLIDAVDSRSSVVERAIVDREAGEEVMLRQPEAGARTTDQQVAAAEESAGASAEATPEVGGEAGAQRGEAEPTTEERAERVDTPQTITDDDIGKRVVSGDEEVGMVAGVEAETLYVDPHPSLTDRIKAALDWGDTDDDVYQVDLDEIESITDDEVRVGTVD